MENLRAKYKIDTEETKLQITDEIQKYTCLSPSDSVQEEIKNCRNQIEALHKAHEHKVKEINIEHQTIVDQLTNKYSTEISDLANTHAEQTKDLSKNFEKSVEQLKSKHSEDLKYFESNFQEKISNLTSEKANILYDLKITKESLNETLQKVEDLNKTIGRYESKESIEEASYSSKDKEIAELKHLNNELILSVKSIQEQTQKEFEDKIKTLDQKIKKYKFKISKQDKRNQDEIIQIEKLHKEEIDILKKTKNLNQDEDILKIESLNNIIKDKDALLKSSAENYNSQIEIRELNIGKLNNVIKDLKVAQASLEAELIKAKEESKLLIERFKEEMHSVLSLKSSMTDEDTIASKDEFNENMKIINEFCENPFSKSLKKIFKLKRVRNEDKSVDSSNLLEKNHQEECGYHETETHNVDYETVERMDVNRGRVEEMAQPGFRPQTQKARGRGVPQPQRGRGVPEAMARGRAGDPRMPPRHKARVGTQATQSTISNNSVPNIQIMDPNKILMKNVRQESPVDKLTGAITTPPRKKSFGMTGSPSQIHRSDPFSLQSVNIKEEVKSKREQLEESEEYEEIEESEEEENEEEKMLDSVQKTAAPPIKQRDSGTKMPVPPPKMQQPIEATESKPPSQISKHPPQASKPPPMIKQRTPPPARDGRNQDRKRDNPPMKPRTDVKQESIENETKQQEANVDFYGQKIDDSQLNQIDKKEQNDNRSKTPQPIPDKSKTLEQSRVSRFSREAEEPSVTHAFVRDKSIGERIRSSLLPGFLGGGSASTLAVETTKTEEVKTSDSIPVEKPVAKEENKSQNKPPLPSSENKQEGAFEGLFNSVLKLLGRKKKESKQAFMGSSGAGLVYDKVKKKYIIPGEENESEDDIPPPPVLVKKKEENKVVPKDIKTKNSKNRLATRYAQTFDANQIMAESPSVSNFDEKPFVPPSFDSLMNQPPSFEFQPEESNSPKVEHISKHPERELESVRQDHISMPKFDDGNQMNPNIEEDYVKFNESETENRNEPENKEENIENTENIVTAENYEKAYNQLKTYKTENKALKREIALNQAKAEMNIDYFVQLCEDVKYRGMEELESLKNKIDILQSEKNKLISKQAQNLALIYKLESDVKILQQKQIVVETERPWKTPQEAKEGLLNGLDELKCFQAILEKLHESSMKFEQKDNEIKNILIELLNNIDENSEQGQILIQSLNGDYDIQNIQMAIQQIFEENAKQLSEISHKIEENFASQITKLIEESKLKEIRISELIQEGFARAKTEEDQTKEYMTICKENEEKDDKISELENEIINLRQNHKKIEEQFESRFQEILDESQIEREEWMKNGAVSFEESSNIKAEIETFKLENEQLRDENIRIHDSCKIMEAEFTKFDEDNKAMRHTIQVLEKEVTLRNEILEQYEMGNDFMIDETQEKLKDMIERNVQAEQKLEDIQTLYNNSCDYLKEIYSLIKNNETGIGEDDVDKSVEFTITCLTEEEIGELYENILSVYESKKREMINKEEELSLRLEEVKIQLENKENELLDFQITGTQSTSSQEYEDKKKMIRILKEKLDDTQSELRNKDKIIKQLNDDLNAKIESINELISENEELKYSIENEEGNDNEIISMTEQIQTLEFEKEKLNSELMQTYSRIDDLNADIHEEAKIYEERINNKDKEIKSLKLKLAAVSKDLEEEKFKSEKAKQEFETNYSKIINTNNENSQKELLELRSIIEENERSIDQLQESNSKLNEELNITVNCSKENENKINNLNMKEREYQNNMQQKEDKIQEYLNIINELKSKEEEYKIEIEDHKNSKTEYHSNMNEAQESLKSQENSFRTQIDSLNEEIRNYQTQVAQFNEKLKAQNEWMVSTQSTSEERYTTLEDSCEELKAENERLQNLLESHKQEHLKIIDEIQQNHKIELNNSVQGVVEKITKENKDREGKFKKQTEEIVNMLKDKLNKQKDKNIESQQLLKDTAEKLKETNEKLEEANIRTEVSINSKEEIERIKKEAATESNVLNSKIQKLNKQLIDKENELKNLKDNNQHSLIEMHNQLLNATQEIEETKNKNSSLESSKSEYESTINSLNISILKLQTSVTNFESEIASIKVKSSDEINSYKNKLESRDLEHSEQISILNSELQTVTRELESVKRQAELHKEELETEKREREILRATLQKKADGILEKKIKDLTEEKETMKKNLENIIEVLSKSNTELEKEVRDYRKLKEEIKRQQEEAEKEEKSGSFFGLF